LFFGKSTPAMRANSVLLKYRGSNSKFESRNTKPYHHERSFGFRISCFGFGSYPCLCLCFGFLQITCTTPLRRMILQLSQIFLT